MRCASRRAATIVRVRSSSGTSIRSVECFLGTTRAWPRVAGLMSMKATVCSSESTTWAGTSPATMPQNRHSPWLASIGGSLFDLGEQPPGERDGVLA
jgi:hypothetical protein